MTVTYDVAPAFSVTQDLDIEILDEECLWEASTSQQWEALKNSQLPRPTTTVRDAMTHLVYGKEGLTAATHPTKWTAFATTMVLHAVNVNMWNVMQCTQSFTAFAVDEQNSKVLKTALVSQVENALARCYALLTADRSERDHTSDDPEGPLIFNCLALLRSAYVRVFTGAGNFDRMVLLSEEPLQVVRTYTDPHNTTQTTQECNQDRTTVGECSGSRRTYSSGMSAARRCHERIAQGRHRRVAIILQALYGHDLLQRHTMPRCN